MIEINPKDAKDFSTNYKIMIGAILPRPIAVVSTRNLDGSNNIAPFSFFTGVCPSPFIVAFCPLIRVSTLKPKDTVINIEREKEFVINFVSLPIIEKINATSTELPYGEDEFVYAGLTPIASHMIRAPRIKESLIHFECILRDTLNYGDHAGAGRLITGEVVKIHLDESIYSPTDGRINTDAFEPIGRGAGIDWIHCDHRTQLERKMGSRA